MPIGLFPDTVYSAKDVVETSLGHSSLCIAYTDGLMDLSRDEDAEEGLPLSLSRKIRSGITESARQDGSCVAAPAKYMKALSELGYDKFHDDITILVFGATVPVAGMFEATVRLLPGDVDGVSQDIAAWCRDNGWPDEGVSRVQLVLEEKLMNIHDHGLTDRERLHEVVSIRLRLVNKTAELTVWDCGSPEPSLAVAAGSTDTGFELANREMSGRGRGRMMVRELCDGIERNRYGELNETIYHIPLNLEAVGGQANFKGEVK